ncbi:MAG: hypothetical protein V4527_06405 [Pseudomonadota bacterium]
MKFKGGSRIASGQGLGLSFSFAANPAKEPIKWSNTSSSVIVIGAVGIKLTMTSREK